VGRGNPGSIIVACALCAAATAAGCEGPQFTAPETLGGKTVSVDSLNRGRRLYRRTCAGCHGPQGDGQGAAADGMKPAPRDFTRGSFKFCSTASGGLPLDDDLLRTVRRGLHGTHMPGWGKAPDSDVQAVVDYIKTFSPRWRVETPPPPVALSPDPWAGAHEKGAQEGRFVYHAKAQCWTCHPSYADQGEIEAMARRVPRDAEPQPMAWRSSMNSSREVMADYGMDTPPDFRKDTLRSDDEDTDLYRTIAAGIGGTPMKAWSARLTTSELWALVHYVRELQKRPTQPARWSSGAEASER